MHHDQGAGAQSHSDSHSLTSQLYLSCNPGPVYQNQTLDMTEFTRVRIRLACFELVNTELDDKTESFRAWMSSFSDVWEELDLLTKRLGNLLKRMHQVNFNNLGATLRKV